MRTDPDLEHDPDSDDSVLFLSAQWRTVHPGQGSDSVSSGFMLSDCLLYAKTTGRSSPALARTSALYSDDHTDIYRKHRIHAVLQPILTCSGRRHHGGMLPALLWIDSFRDSDKQKIPSHRKCFVPFDPANPVPWNLRSVFPDTGRHDAGFRFLSENNGL